MTTFGDVGVPVMDSRQLWNSWVRASRSVMHFTIIQTVFLNKLDFSEAHLSRFASFPLWLSIFYWLQEEEIVSPLSTSLKFEVS